MTANPPTVKNGWTVQTPHRELAAPKGGTYRLAFGKYRGCRLDEVPVAYVLWLIDHTPSPALRLLAKKALELDVILDDGDPCQETAPSGALAADVLPLLAFDWAQRMAAEFGEPAPDTETAFVLNRGVWHLRDLVAAHTGRRFPSFDELEGDSR